MKRNICLIAVLLWIIVFALNVFAQEEAPAPSYNNGDFWQFSVKEKLVASSSRSLDGGIYEVRHVNGKFPVFEIQGDKREQLDAAGGEINALRWMLGQGQTLGGQSLKFPLKVGEKWNFDYRLTARAITEQPPRSAEVKVVGMETVSTPAGTFKAFKLLRVDSGAPVVQRGIQRSAAEYTITYFYSPEVRSIVKSFFDFSGRGGTREIELVKFGTAKPIGPKAGE
jgi:hypothetical protein